MVKGPVPVSPAIAATFNAMTPSGAQLTSFFFFLLQLPKNFYQTAHTKRAVMILTTLEHRRNPSKSEKQKEWGPKSLYPIAPPPPPPPTHTSAKEKRKLQDSKSFKTPEQRESPKTHTRVQKAKGNKKGDENTRRKMTTESLNWGWKSDAGILLGGVSVRLLLNLGAISHFSSTIKASNIHL
jgi:hypothetical protein